MAAAPAPGDFSKADDDEPQAEEDAPDDAVSRRARKASTDEPQGEKSGWMKMLTGMFPPFSNTAPTRLCQQTALISCATLRRVAHALA